MQPALKDPETWKYVEKEQRLLDLFVQNQNLLDQFLKKQVVERIEPTINGELHSAFEINQNEEELLEPLVDKLPEEDAEYFHGAMDNGLFYESTEHLWKRLQPTMINAAIEIDDIQ